MTSEYSENARPLRRPGRPRSEQARLSILGTTAKMMEDLPIRSITIDGIAKAANVGKPTIYRWWDSKCALVMDAFLERMTPASPPKPDTDITQNLVNLLKGTIEHLRGREGEIVAEIIGEGQSDPHILEEFHTRFFCQILKPARQIIERAKEIGMIDQNLDTNLALDILYGPIYYRLLVRHQPLDDHFTQSLPGRVVSALQLSAS
ncbi:MAG: TetR/AcrR family transcriptional regulator [Robiginitomaculum sp.]|nr:TetR/AcrR family transcriptional regulator [Robiginitomaculum sp.]MDQ7078169.1 TetR/AcrR family transcriptional regulator [Robiginitomaculum sp.]